MDEHEWELDIIEGSIFRNTDDGLEFMDLDEAQRRLNATERLSAENARWIAEDYVLAYPEHLGYARSKQTEALLAYADTLEGK